MNKKILYSIAIAMMVLLAACSSEENLPETGSETTRTISLTATMPDEPDTRVSLELEEDRSITVLWEKDDIIHLAFTQNGTWYPAYFTSTVDYTSNNGKTAHFNIPAPYTSGEFKVYGTFGGGGIVGVATDFGSNPGLKLPEYPINATSLNGLSSSIQSRKDVALYFEHSLSFDDTQAKVQFNHIGSIFHVSVINKGLVKLTGIEPVQLIGVTPGNEQWGYSGTGQFNLVNKQFYNVSSTNIQQFKTTQVSLEVGEILETWSWMPIRGNEWPALKVMMFWAGLETAAGTITNKPPRTPLPGKTYHLYAIWNGNKLQFTDQLFTEP